MRYKPRIYYVFAMNGAAIKCHARFEDALRQARQWKNNYPDRRVEVETYDPSLSVDQRVRARQEVTLPMLVPAKTPRHDWEDGYEGTDPSEQSRALVNW